MAKEKEALRDGEEKTKKPEKKVSTDKVKRRKTDKEGKYKRAKVAREAKRSATTDSSDNEPSIVEDTPTAAAQPPVEPSPAASAELTDAQKKKQAKKEAKEARMEARKEAKVARKEAKAKKQAAKAAAAEGVSTSGALPVRTATQGSEGEGAEEAAPLFAIDTNPTPVDPDSLVAPEPMDVDEDERKGKGKAYIKTKPPSGLNREARRRIKLIERQREAIQKKLGVPEGSNEKAADVQALLDEWTVGYDDKHAIRVEKKHQRKEKEAARLRNRRGKILTGRKLKERQKQLDKRQKKEAKNLRKMTSNES
ncbi:hypothetical protein F5B20DRAFT_586582 [Whalleya microplaca]|nr:hypothetical protein F5B20DRAFT_586582 [Whalleya microplaca]